MVRDAAQRLTGADAPESIAAAIAWHARYSVGDDWGRLAPRDRFLAVSYAARDRVMDRLLETEARVEAADAKRLYYLSMEFLMGRALVNNLLNLGLHGAFRVATGLLGVDLEDVAGAEPDPALGNGGLGRLAACFLDSLATLDLPGYGYGINYDFGLFRQEIVDGEQREKPDPWKALGAPWQIERREEACLVPVYGRVLPDVDREGRYNPMWLDWRLVVGVPHDMPVVGWGGKTVTFLRLYSARASDEFDMEVFNQGDYIRAVEEKIHSETVSKVLYPADLSGAGKELRLLQEYFFVACALRDVVRRYLKTRTSFEAFPEKVAIQLNDTHPALAVAELMRTFVDEQDVPWEKAWELTKATFGYTNHTLMSEALEKWSVALMERVLPRHLEVIYEINRRFLDRVGVLFPGEEDVVRRVSIIEEGREKQVRMAHLAIVGSHSVNGVSKLHSELVKSALVPDFFRLFPERFNNKTNGVTPRRWLLLANPGLAALVTSAIGTGWVTDLDELKKLEPFAEDAGFREEFRAVRRANKERLLPVLRGASRAAVDPASLFDVQAKRIHEYKRPLLNVLHIVHLYLTAVEDGELPEVPRTFLFGGKAAPGYRAAKRIIRLIHRVAAVVNRDPRTRGLLRVFFLPDYRVSLAERLIPAADVSEQISTAGMEASGTGNMKFALNGALTVGTMDGANIEIREEVGDENVFIFGKTAAEIAELKLSGDHPRQYFERDPRLHRVLDAIRGDLFSAGEPGAFEEVFDALVERNDPYFHLADFASYEKAHTRVSETFARPDVWTRKAILNVARMGRFSSDRTVREYAREIWGLVPVP